MKCRADELELVNGQIRAQRIAHGHGWYDESGVPLGCGDLDHSDFERVRGRSKKGQWLVTISEADAQKYVGRILTSDEMIAHAHFAVTHGEMYHLDPSAPPSLVAVDYYGATFTVVSTDTLRALMLKMA